MTLPAGSRLGRYQIISLLGAGGMGMVYRARDDRLQRDVAIKVLPPSVLSDETARRRFTREALALAKLSHPHIAAIYDVGDDAEMAYLVMELVPGESLATRLESGPLPLADALTYCCQIADALGEAHEQGVVHRDLKPANVMITPKGQLKVLDFGLAKLLAPLGAPTGTLSRSELGAPAGTPLYMSPEQAFGEQVDTRTDLWSLGVMLFETLTCKAPFTGATDWALLKAVSQEAPASLSALRPDLPASVEPIVMRALAKDPAARFQTASEFAATANQVLQTISAPKLGVAPTPAVVRSKILAGVGAGVIAAAVVGGWFALRASHRNWARNEAPAAIKQLIGADLRLAANSQLHRALRYLPADTTLKGLLAANTRTISVTSSPSGAAVAIQDYLTPDSAWTPLGVTPLSGITVPTGYFRWRVTPAGAAPVILAPELQKRIHFALDSAAMAPAGMVRVGAHNYTEYDAFLGWVGPYHLPPFAVDKFEVTNRQYQQFVDSGGYRTQRYWTEKFAEGDKELSWDSAMTRFRDRTGRSGPSTWEGGHYPAGQADDPVGGVSWYEASAYAAFRGNTLPAMAEWHLVGPPEVTRYIGKVSNMNATHPVSVGTFPGVGPYGTYDMAGNVREWVSNENDEHRRFILGGAWSSPAYLYANEEALPPFDRSATNGFRTVRNLAPLPAAVSAPVKMLRRDFSHYTPASDAVFDAYKLMYAYDSTPLNSRSEGIVQQTPDWRLEKVTFDAAYGGERMAAYLYIPTHVKPPYQAVLFFPSARILGLTDSKNLGDTGFFDYVVQSGRAVLYPVYQDTYERRLRHVMPGASQAVTLTTERAKDVGRALDYLQSRPDIARDKLAYMGVSMGAAEGAIFATLEQARLKTAIFLDGGFFLDPPARGGDQADFVPRMKKPVLMVNGRYDATFTYEPAQLPMIQMLGTPAADKKHLVLEASHDVTAERPALVRAVLDWLDKYMGRVE